MSIFSADSDPDATRAKDHLEWERLEQAVLSRCHGSATKRRGLPIEQSPGMAQTALSECADAMALLQAGEALPLHDFRDIESHLARVARGGDLDGPALADVRVMLRAARAVRRFLKSRSERVRHLLAVCHLDPSLDAMEEILARAIEVDGTLFDHASEDLRKLRGEVSQLRARIIARLEQLIDRHKELLSDRYHTIREGRYVVPVRTDAHERFSGIVHATSESGASVFVEPGAIVQQGNRLKMAQAELQREEQRILSELSALVAERHSELMAAVETLARLDLREASAKTALSLEAHVPTLRADGGLDLRKARHPLLALSGADVVDNDLSLEAGQGLIISGPNAGGKTVLLKTVGLFALMVRAGLPIPTAPGSTMGYFDPVLSELGDAQSTQHNLSTFSAHVRSLAHILSRAGGRALVLLDELCGGTDPQEGAALACAVAEQLVQDGATLILTTHYEPLKAFALREPRLRSGSVGFDLGSMEPSFVLHMDVPGASSALVVARRFGIPDAVTQRARDILPDQAKDFEALIAQLNQKSHALRQEQDVLQEARAEVEHLRRDYEHRLSQLKERSRRRLTEEAEQVFAELREARDALRKVRSALRDKELERAAIEEAEREVRRIGQRMAVGGDLSQASADDTGAAQEGLADPGDLTIESGTRVYVAHLRSEGVVLEADDRGRARVAVGPLKLWVERTGLRAARDADGVRSKPSSVEPARAAPAGRTVDNTLSVRGMRVDDALPMMESFIDRLLMTSMRHGFIDHGHGSGALRRAVRTHLRDALAHVHMVRPGNNEEGGDAVTAFVLLD